MYKLSKTKTIIIQFIGEVWGINISLEDKIYIWFKRPLLNSAI